MADAMQTAPYRFWESPITSDFVASKTRRLSSHLVCYSTSKGYAYFALNRSGSTEFGREYRNSLFGHWGELDVAEAAEVGEYLKHSDIVFAGEIGITGISAGGYHTLQCLARHPGTFAAGICASGISQTKTFDAVTHKLEWNYVSLLLGLPNDDEESADRINRERSALSRVDKIEAPLLLLHGARDTVAPVEQARHIAAALDGRGGRVKLVEFEVGHVLPRPSMVRGWLEPEEEEWWRRTLL